jgi:DNA-binding transcriptional ArsR family regulator
MQRDFQLVLPRDVAEIGRVLSCAVRLEVLVAVVRERCDVTTIARRVDIDPADASGHLRVLRIAGMVACEPVRQRRVYSPGPVLRHSQDGEVLAIAIRAKDGNELLMRLLPGRPSLPPPIPVSRPGAGRGRADRTAPLPSPQPGSWRQQESKQK